MSIDPILASQIPIRWMVTETPSFLYLGCPYSVRSDSYATMEGLIEDLPLQQYPYRHPSPPTIAIYLLERSTNNSRIYFRFATLDNSDNSDNRSITAPEEPTQTAQAAQHAQATQENAPEHPLYIRKGDRSSAGKYNRLVDLALDNQRKLDLIIECIKKGKVTNAIQGLELQE